MKYNDMSNYLEIDLKCPLCGKLASYPNISSNGGCCTNVICNYQLIYGYGKDGKDVKCKCLDPQITNGFCKKCGSKFEPIPF